MVAPKGRHAEIDLLGSRRSPCCTTDQDGRAAPRHPTVDLNHLTLDDPEVYRLLSARRTAGVFQFESALATDCLPQHEVRDRFDDLVATNALLRPGPLDSPG